MAEIASPTSRTNWSPGSWRPSEPTLRLFPLADATTLWRLTCQIRSADPIHGLVFLEYRALSEGMALDLAAHYRPDLTVCSIERRPSGS